MKIKQKKLLEKIKLSMASYPDAVKRYFDKYKNDKRIFLNKIPAKYELAIIVPVLSESENIKKLFASLNENVFNYFEKIILIIVVNNTLSASEAVKKENLETLIWLRKEIEENNYKFSIGLVDASTPGNEMPDKTGGVGLARKIGMDLALTTFDYISSNKKILVCLDADCAVDENYFKEIYGNFNQHNFSAAYVSFEHKIADESENSLAIICYEIFLRYYILGLMFADSPYAFHTIGSTMICDYESYINIEGMNKRKAAEDFYFMEKLAKNYKINKIDNTAVYPSGRGSWRVPFGTGQRVNRFLSKQQNEYLLYNPASFIVLKYWLNVFNNPAKCSAKDYLSQAKEIHEELYNFLVDHNSEGALLQIIRNAKNERQLAKQKRSWFDGFKTLKLIHHLRDTAFPQTNMFDALDELLLYFNIIIERDKQTDVPDFKTQLKYLNILREIA
jgi:hypothetical protein